MSENNKLTYGTTPSSPASIHPVEIEKWKGNISETFKKYFEEEYKQVIGKIEILKNTYDVNKLVYESSISFEPLIGHTYHLYQRKDGRFLSLLSPNESRWDGYIGSYRLNSSYVWEQTGVL